MAVGRIEPITYDLQDPRNLPTFRRFLELLRGYINSFIGAGVAIPVYASSVNVAATRVTGDTTLDTTHCNVFCDTDGGAITITLPAGSAGRVYRIINCGSSGNDVTVTPDGSELLTGANASRTLSDKSVIILTYETTEGWW